MARAMTFQSSQSQASKHHPKEKKKVICLLAFILLSTEPMREGKQFLTSPKFHLQNSTAR